MEKDAASTLLQRLQSVKSSMIPPKPKLQSPIRETKTGSKGFWDALLKAMPADKPKVEKKPEEKDDPRKKRLALLLMLSQRQPKK